MATLAHGAHSASLTQPAPAHRSLLARFLAWYAERRAIAQTMRDLNQMDARDLHDLGITPYDFDAIAHGVFKR
jgi:uncharacterized protein YjiS (DUF1127 family)